MLPISHDEVVYGKGSLIGKMPGDEWQRFANARAFLAFMFGHPGKKLLFMGCEIGQYGSGTTTAAFRWDLLNFDYHRKLQTLVQELNRLYRAERALYEVDFSYTGFEWVDFRDAESVRSLRSCAMRRMAQDAVDVLLQLHAGAAQALPVWRAGGRASTKRF